MRQFIFAYCSVRNSAFPFYGMTHDIFIGTLDLIKNVLDWIRSTLGVEEHHDSNTARSYWLQQITPVRSRAINSDVGRKLRRNISEYIHPYLNLKYKKNFKYWNNGKCFLFYVQELICKKLSHILYFNNTYARLIKFYIKSNLK